MPTSAQQLNDDFDSMARSVLRVKHERDALLSSIFAYFNADSESSKRAAREQMRDAVELSTGKRLYDYFAHQDCSPQPDGEAITELYDAIRESIGDGDPLDLLLRDEYNRRKLHLHARAL